MTEPTAPEPTEPEPTELPDGFHEPESEWSTEQRPGFVESTRTDEPS